MKRAVSEANRLLPQALAAAHGHLLRGAAQFEPCTHDVAGARRALHFIDKVMPYAQNRGHVLAHVRVQLVAALEVAGADPTPHHPRARQHDLEERAARAARAIRHRIDTLTMSAPPQHARRIVAGVEHEGMAHDVFDDASVDPVYMAEWCAHLALEETRRDTGADAAQKWQRMADELRAAMAKAA